VSIGSMTRRSSLALGMKLEGWPPSGLETKRI